MKKTICIMLFLALMLSCSAMAATISPQIGEINITDATWAASFDRANLKDGTLTGVHIFSEDVYDIVDIDKLAVGDTFEAEGKSVTVEALGTDEFGHVTINGGYEAENGYTLTTEEDTNGWTTLTWDDFCTYTERGVYDLELAENVALADSWDIDGETVTANGIDGVAKAIMESANDAFDQYNTELVIENGKVTEINRHYVP